MIQLSTLSQPEEPRQCKLLGATVKGLGLVTAVSSTLFSCFAMIEDERGVRHHRFLSTLSKDEVTFPSEPQPYVRRTERIGVGTYEEVFGLIDAQPVAVALQVAA